MSSRKLTVEVCNAKNLMPKDCQGTASAYVIVDFDGQRRRTKTIFRDLNPQWKEKLELLVHDVESMASEMLELNVNNDKKNVKMSIFLGKVEISGITFVKYDSKIGLNVWYVDEETPAPPATYETVAKSGAGCWNRCRCFGSCDFESYYKDSE
ncbi:C2 calcium/lipid-binding plant phosphoribosyltransferase family protein [Forsythia ovata]|uniref:C2 calcium/lipid-binding plant phosphoribosyltransferase family protein n=1 Tax=Forsythia ovata TaxID=205694 RepID=A0ABD1QA90_9LAMI